MLNYHLLFLIFADFNVNLYRLSMLILPINSISIKIIQCSVNSSNIKALLMAKTISIFTGFCFHYICYRKKPLKSSCLSFTPLYSPFLCQCDFRHFKIQTKDSLLMFYGESMDQFQFSQKL